MNEMQNKNEYLTNKTEIIKPLQSLNLTDDFLFDVSTEDLEVCQIIIELSLIVCRMPQKSGIPS